MNKTQYTLYGWQLSYYTGKVRTYMRYKNLPVSEKEMNFLDFRRVEKQTGSRVMPALVSSSGEWLQDTAHIIDELEQRHPEKGVKPTNSVQNFAAHLLETWFDEAWVPIAMHTRWTYPENYALFEKEGGDALLPYMPSFLKKHLIGKISEILKRYTPGVGIIPEQFQQIENAANKCLDQLDAYFAGNDYLFGARASVADFGLAGPIYGHLGRDPWPKREMVDPRKNLSAWLQRISAQKENPLSDWQDVDDIPSGLKPIFATIAEEFVPKCVAVIKQVQQIAEDPSAKELLPRILDPIATPLDGKDFKHTPLSFVAWKVKRLQDLVEDLDLTEKAKVRHWASENGFLELLDERVPPMSRHGLRLKLRA
jgi:glutathione S-transferase